MLFPNLGHLILIFWPLAGKRTSSGTSQNYQNFQPWPVQLAQWVACNPAKQKVARSIPGQGTYPDCGFGPWLGRVGKITN